LIAVRQGEGARCPLAATLFLLTFLSACGSSSDAVAEPVVTKAVHDLGLHPGAAVSRASLRGLHAVDDRVAWTSGSGGAYGRTGDGGKSWTFHVVPGARGFDFRDVVAFDSDHAWLMSAGSGGLSRIYQTADGGRHWRLRWTNPHPEGFMDGMAAWSARRALAYGDPVDGHIYVLRTADGGRHWERAPTVEMPAARTGEAAFAASGTGVQVFGRSTAWLATGGPDVARVFRTDDGGDSWVAHETPLTDASATSGIFSMAFRDGRHGVVVGGDFLAPDAAHANAAWTDDGGLTWHRPTRPPRGYRSGVTYIPGTETLICVGPAGMDVSHDGGRTWGALEGAGSHAVRAVEGRVYTSGARGRLAATR